MRSYLGPVETVGKRIDCFDSIDSTNAYLKRIALDGAPDGTVAVAAEQTSGRGRRGRSFQSAAGKGVYLSILLRPKLAPSQLMPLTGAHRRCDEPRGRPRGGDALADQVDKRSHPERQKALRHFDRAERRG